MGKIYSPAVSILLIASMLSLTLLAGCTQNTHNTVDPLTIPLEKGRPGISNLTLGWAVKQALTQASYAVERPEELRLAKITVSGHSDTGIIDPTLGIWVYLWTEERFDKVYEVTINEYGVMANGLGWWDPSVAFFGEYFKDPSLKNETLFIENWWVDSDIIYPQAVKLMTVPDEEIIRTSIIPRRAATDLPNHEGTSPIFYFVTNDFDYYFNAGNRNGDHFIAQIKPGQT